MLVLERYAGQSFKIGNNIIVKILKHDERIVRLGIQAPKNLKVLREELEDIPINSSRNSGKKGES